MHKFLVLHSLSMDHTLGLRLPGVTELPGKTMCRGIKVYSANVKSFKPNALTKHRSISFRCHQAIQLLVIMMQFICLKQLGCVIIETPMVIAMVLYSNTIFMHPNY